MSYFTCITLAFVLTDVTRASNRIWFDCHGDVCYIEEEHFCSDFYKMCRPCSKVLHDCFTPDMPRNCTKTCLNDFAGKRLKAAQEKHCEDLKDIEHGKHNGSQSVKQQQGISILYSCDHGYRLIGLDLMHCKQYGQWSSPPPTCKEITCPVLSSISNGRHNGSTKQLSQDSVVVSFCDDGAQLYGKNVTTCSQDGQWTNNLPICEPIMCTKPPPIRNGRWSPLQQSSKQFPQGYILHAQCDTGYSTDSSSIWTCHEGVWQSNDSFVPVCLSEGDSVNIVFTLSLVASCFVGVLIFSCIICRVIKCLRNHKASKKNDANSIEESSNTSIFEEQSFLDNKVKPNDSLGVFSLCRKHKRKAVLGSTDDALPKPNTVDGQSKVNIVNVETVVYVDNQYNNNASFLTSDRNDGDQNAPSTGITNVTPQPQQSESYENYKTSVEETGDLFLLEDSDASDATARKQSVELPIDVLRIQPKELLNDAMPMVPDSQNINESLNVEPFGGTEPKSLDDSSLPTLPQTSNGTQPLKPDDEHTSFHTEFTLNEDSVHGESDEEGMTSSLLPHTPLSGQTGDDGLDFLSNNLLSTEDNNL